MASRRHRPAAPAARARAHVWRRWVDTARFQIARFKWLHATYVEHHLTVELPGCRFEDDEGQLIGAVTDLRLHRGRMRLAGWALARVLTVELGDARVVREPHEEHVDLADVPGCRPNMGFSASLPADDAPLVFEIAREGRAPLRLHHAPAVATARSRARWRLEMRFWADLLPRLPMVALGLWRADGDLPRRLKLALRLTETDVETVLDPVMLVRAPAAARPVGCEMSEIRVIMPVYNAFDAMVEALQCFVAHTDLPWRLILIEDGSSDGRVRPWLRDWVGAQAAQGRTRIVLIENEGNLGFVQSVNRGLAQVGDGRGPVVLLNSDAMVPKGWASRLTAPLADPAVASVTPLSNDAEIFSAPVIGTRTRLAPGQGAWIDAALRLRLAPDAPGVTAPTGVGFCMAIGGDWLARIGPFDPAFGRGYGEEVDWCQRASAAGGRHVAAPNLFVEHRGGASFGSEKAALVQKSAGRLASRYPGYGRAVQTFIRTDPLVTARFVAALAWAESLPGIDEIPVYIAHSLGGGAEHYLAQRLAHERVSLVLRFGGAYRCRIELATPSGRLVTHTDTLDDVVRLLAPVAKRRIVYSCAVGDPDVSALPDFLVRLAETAPLDVLFHDYLPISPSITLLDNDGGYRGVPGPERTDQAHVVRRPDGSEVSLAAWQAAWRRVIDLAERVVVFSRAAAEVVTTAYPNARPQVVAHEVSGDVPRLSAPTDAPMVVGVLGSIGPHKGAGVIAALSQQLETVPEIGLAVIGQVAPGFALGPRVPVHGAYEIADLAALVARYAITHWLIPSIWPETFCYTVHECLATGLPTLAFDLGGQGDAVGRAENGVLLAWVDGETDPDGLAQRVYDSLIAVRHDARPVSVIDIAVPRDRPKIPWRPGLCSIPWR